MTKQVNVVFATNDCEYNTTIKGYYRKGFLNVNFSEPPKEICILVDEPISLNDAENCMQQLREKLYACQELIINAEVMRYHNHAPSSPIFGGLTNESLNKSIEEKCFKEIHFYITYSLHDLN